MCRNMFFVLFSYLGFVFPSIVMMAKLNGDKGKWAQIPWQGNLDG